MMEVLLSLHQNSQTRQPAVMPTVPTSTRNSREPPVSSFSGEKGDGKSADFSTWLPSFEECAITFEYTEQAKTFWLKQKLTGAAHSFIQSQDNEIRNNYQPLIEALSSYFKDTTSATMRYTELFSCKQDSDESVKVFGERLCESMRKTERLENLTSDVVKKHLFITGVKDNYKGDLLAKMDDATTFEQLYEIARNLE